MPIKDAAAIDKNFKVPNRVLRDDLVYYNAKELDVYGLTHEGGIYRRMPYEIAKKVSDNVAQISCECAGGRVRFATNSPYIAIFVKYRSVSKVPNYSNTATLGFDLYSAKRYIGCFVPAIDTLEAFESIINLEDAKDTARKKEYTLNFPVCSEIEELYIGVQEGSIMEKAPKYAIEKPIVFYGSSVTQGACASRPGNTYANIISRTLNCDYVNLGFWGNALGEPEMASYIAGLNMSAFVLDYDYNAPMVEHLVKTHEKMFQIIRERNPNLPIIILSRPKYYLNEEAKQAFEVIKTTYENAIARGDKHVSLIAGMDMLKSVKDTALADNIHPGDSGFISMARIISAELKKFLKP